MMPDGKHVTGFLKRKKQRESAARFFVELLPADAQDGGGGGGGAISQPLSLVDQLLLCPSFRDVQALERYLSSGPLNDFVSE